MPAFGRLEGGTWGLHVGGHRLLAGGPAILGPPATRPRPRPWPRAGVAWAQARLLHPAPPGPGAQRPGDHPQDDGADRGARPARHEEPGKRAHASPRPSLRRAHAARPRPAGAPTPRTPAPAAPAAAPHSPSLAFFLRARVPPSFPKKESSFFRDGGDLGVGDLGTEGDFCGEEAMAVERTAAGRSGRGAGAGRARRD